MAVRPLRISADIGHGAHLHRSPARGESLAEPGGADQVAPGGEVGAFDETHQFFGVGIGVLEGVEGGVDHLPEIVGGDVGGHSDGDALAAVDEEVRETGRKHGRLFGLARVVLDEVDGVLSDPLEQAHREVRQPRLGVARGSRGVVDGPEVPLRVDQQMAKREVLAHPHQGVIDAESPWGW